MANGFGHSPEARRWALGAAVLTTLLAALDAAAPDTVLLGAFVLGPLLAAARSGIRETIALAAYALTLGVVAGLWDGIFLNNEHLTRLLALGIGASVSVWIAMLRVAGERTTNQLLAQNALAVTLVESRSLADAAPKALEAIGRTLDWQLGVLWRVDETQQALHFAGCWQEPGVQAAGFVGVSRRKTFARGEPLPGEAWRRDEPAWIEDVTSAEGYTRA